MGNEWTPYKPTLEDSQNQKVWFINGRMYDRITYDMEDSCPDCGATATLMASQYHALSCPQEQCPGCDGQSISCPCQIEEAKKVDLVTGLTLAGDGNLRIQRTRILLPESWVCPFDPVDLR